MPPQLAIYLFIALIVGLIAQAKAGGGLFTRVCVTVVAGFFWPISALVGLANDLGKSRQ